MDWWQTSTSSPEVSEAARSGYGVRVGIET
jgi:hypothetical protein